MEFELEYETSGTIDGCLAISMFNRYPRRSREMLNSNGEVGEVDSRERKRERLFNLRKKNLCFIMMLTVEIARENVDDMVEGGIEKGSIKLDEKYLKTNLSLKINSRFSMKTKGDSTTKYSVGVVLPYQLFYPIMIFEKNIYK